MIWMSLLGDIQKCTVYFWRLVKNLTSLELFFSVECGESQIGEGFDSRKFVVFGEQWRLSEDAQGEENVVKWSLGHWIRLPAQETREGEKFEDWEGVSVVHVEGRKGQSQSGGIRGGK